MKSPVLLLNFAIILIYIKLFSASTDKIVCYYGSWAYYRNGNGKFVVNNINSTLCTHLIYSFVGLEENGNVKILDNYLEQTLGNIQAFNVLKNKNPNVKTLLAIGGWNEGSIKYSNVVADAGKRTVFIQSALNLIQTYNFDGFDLDWEYPALRGGIPSDKENFLKLIKELRTEWNKYGLLLTAAVKATSIDSSYDVRGLSEYLDFISIMTYDFHGYYDGITGQNAPLYASSIDKSYDAKLLNVHMAINGWIEKGANPQKLVLGLATYGRTYTLSNINNNGIGAPVSGGGNPGKYTQESGLLAYNEICELLLEDGWTVVWDNQQKNPYAYKNNQWIGYDNPESLKWKIEYAKSFNLGGVMIWSIEMDDFNGICGIKNPLLTAINSIVFENSYNDTQSTSSTTSSTTTKSTTRSTTTEKPPSSDVCYKPGYVRDPNNCSVFYYCLLIKDTFIALRQTCNAGLVFDPVNIICNYPELVDC